MEQPGRRGADRAGRLRELAGRLERAGPANNLALLVGHGTLRLTANGLEEELRPGAAERMAALAAEAFEAGAVGLSSGLIYVPGSYAGTGELVALAWSRPPTAASTPPTCATRAPTWRRPSTRR